jgi:iron complex transport system ATP-binding protein
VETVGGMDALVVEDVAAGYGGPLVLDGVTLRVAAGEFVGIIGPNGSGKSTLVRAVSRVLHLVRGRVLVAGRDVARMSRRAIAREMAVVPQTQPTVYDFTVEDIVRMGRTAHLGRFEMAGEADRAACRRAMEATEVFDLRARSLVALSGGERQRVLIARALAQEPHLLLLDEPDAHLDINHKVEVFDLLAALNRSEGLTVVCISHDLNLAAQYAERLVLLAEGRVAADDAPEAILTEANLRRVYGAETVVRPHPVTGRPQVSLVPGSAAGVLGDQA